MKQSGLLLWFFAVATVFGQPDSKIFVLKNSLLQESDKREIVNLLNELAWEYRQINLDSSLYYAQNGLRALTIFSSNFVVHTVGIFYLSLYILQLHVSVF